jgi:4-carboxymuconolactone decarboxylase
MDKERFEAGLAKRKAVLGEAYVEKSLAQADDFSRPFQELVTAGASPGATSGSTPRPAPC